MNQREQQGSARESRFQQDWLEIRQHIELCFCFFSFLVLAVAVKILL